MRIWTVFLLLLTLTRSEEEEEIESESNKEELRIGGLFEESKTFAAQIFAFAANWVNENDLLPEFSLVTDIQYVDAYDSFKVSLQVCDMMSEGVAAVFGPRSVDTSDHVQSICDALEIPHVEMRWDSRQRRGSCLVNVFPHPSSFSRMVVDLVDVFEWKTFTILYEDNDGLIRLNGLLSFYDHEGYPVTVRQLDEGNDYRPTLKRIKNAEQKNIILDCSIDILYDVLIQALQVGLFGADYSYIITSLDFHTIDWQPFAHADTNITGVRFFDPASRRIEEFINLWNEKSSLPGITGETLTAEIALTHDAVLLYSKAVSELQKSLSIQLKPLSCDNKESWEHGYSVINYMKVSEVEGLTGLIKFDHEGFRTDFSLEIVELNSGGFLKKGTWNISEGVNLTRTFDTAEVDVEVPDLRNMTFVVMISLIDPHAMFKEDIRHLSGNDKYEGMAIDVIHELSLMNGFNYTFKEQKEGGSGNPDATGKWNGMIGEVLAKRADLAIADITITQEREKDADFTLPYMILGISILYKKPSKSPSLFSFLSPFSTHLWEALCAAYVGVSLLMYVIARISPKEWTNPYPCVDEDDLQELENQFSLNNSFWFITGSIMQQGSEIAPISVSTRLLASAWWFFTLIIVSSYTANLAAFLTVEQNEDLFSNVEELANQKPNAPVFVKYGAKAGGATESFFRLSNHSTYQRMWHYMQENYDDVMMKSNRDGVNRVLSETEEYAFLMESASIDYEVQRHCELIQVGNPLDSKGYGIVMNKGAWFRNILSSSVIKLQEKGVFSQLYKKWWQEKRGGGACLDEGEASEAEPLNLDNVGGVFLVLVFGTVFAGFVSVGELMLEVFLKEDRGPFWRELRKELLFVICSNESVKKLRESSEETASASEEEYREPDNKFILM